MDVVVFLAHDLSFSPADDGELRTTAVGCVHYIGKTGLWKKEENIDPCSICKNNSQQQANHVLKAARSHICWGTQFVDLLDVPIKGEEARYCPPPTGFSMVCAKSSDTAFLK